MLIQFRPGGLGAQWRQLSKLGKAVLITVAFFFLLAILWGTGTVDVDYVRNQFKSTPENHGDEPIPHENNDTPIIDGVPNDQNDRPIPNGVIEESKEKQSTENNSSDVKPTPEEEEGVSSIDTEPVRIDPPEKHTQHATSSATPKPTTTRPAGSYSQSPTSFEIKPVKTEPAKPPTKPIAGGVPLRVMFVGASITLGDPPQSAYRMRLREWLVSLGNAVNFVGTNRFGEFKDNDVQAYPATPIQILHEKALKAVPKMQPNLIVVNAGSSDCFQEEQWGSAHGYDYTRALVDFLFEASPRATVVLSTLVTSTSPQFERCIKSINAQIRQVAVDVRRAGKHLLLSEQHYDQGLPGRVTAEFIKSDKMHPTYEGWEMMATIFKQDILEADAKGWIVAPVKNGVMDDGDAERDLEDAAAKAKAKEEEERKKAKEEEERKKKEQEEKKKPQVQKADDEKITIPPPPATHARRLRRSPVW